MTIQKAVKFHTATKSYYKATILALTVLTIILVPKRMFGKMKKMITLLVILCVLTSSVEAKKKKKNKRAKFQTQILSVEEENSPDKCAKVCSGTVERQDTDFAEDYRDGEVVSVDVDMTRCGFVKIPNVVISIEGSTRHSNFPSGTSSVFNTTSTGFKVYLNDQDAYFESNLNIDWVAIGFTC